MYDRGGVVIYLNANGYPQGSTNEWSYDRTRIEMMVFLWCLQAGHNRIAVCSRLSIDSRLLPSSNWNGIATFFLLLIEWYSPLLSNKVKVEEERRKKRNKLTSLMGEEWLTRWLLPSRLKKKRTQAGAPKGARQTKSKQDKERPIV